MQVAIAKTYLIPKGADQNEENLAGRHLIHYTANYGIFNDESIDSVIQHTINIDILGRTTLFIAIKYNRRNIVLAFMGKDGIQFYESLFQALGPMKGPLFQ